MYEISSELKEKIVCLNSVLNEKYKNLLSMDVETLRTFIKENVGEIVKLEKIPINELEKYSKKGGIIGVDGSNNKMGGAYPHYIEMFQGLAKSTIYQDKPIYKADFHTPLYVEEKEEMVLGEKEEIQSKGDTIRNYKLASIEVEAALEGIRTLDPYAVIMDGSLIRYDIECFDKWIEIRKECEKRDIIIIGVIEDIKTSIIGKQLIEKGKLDEDEMLYDRELLYGLLDYGEVVVIKDEVASKSKEGFSSIFMRSSKAPTVIGMDILDTQREYLKEMARLVFSLTPKDSRGVPLWLDIVDKEVQISDRIMKQLLEEYLDREIYELLFISERDKRTL